MRFLPWERSAKRPEVSFEIQAFVQAVEATPKEDLIQTLQVLLPLLFFIISDSLLFVFEGDSFLGPKFVENPVGKDHYTGVIFFLIQVDLVVC